MKHTIKGHHGGRVVVERHDDVISITVVSGAGNAASIAVGPHVAASILMAIGIEADAALEAMEKVSVTVENLGPATAGAAAGTAHAH